MSRTPNRSSAAFLISLLVLLGCSSPQYPTPLEEAEGPFLTPHPEMVSFLEGLQEGTGAFTMERIGTSVEGRDLLLLRFSGLDAGGQSSDEGTGASEGKLKILFFAQQHGNEHSGMEASVILARDIATGAFSEFREHVEFYLIPQVNPDGSEARQRQNADGFDLNRDHLPLFTPEVLAVHQVFQEVMPDVVLDVHEYGTGGSSWLAKGIRKDFGQQIDGLTNANMSLELRTFAVDRVIAEMREALVARDVRLNRYLVTDGPDARFRHSTGAINDGRNSTGIYNALTFLIEGKNGLTVEDNIRERARQQLETMKAFLTFFGENAAEVKRLVEREQSLLAGENGPYPVALVMDFVRDPDHPTVEVGVVDAETGEEGTLLIEDYFPRMQATLFVDRPQGYVIPPELTGILQVLERHGIPTTRLDGPIQAEVEEYRITGVESIQKEDKDFLQVEVSAARKAMEIPTGHILVTTHGLQANLIVTLLEPQSQWGLAPLPAFSSMLEVGSDYPILRVTGM